MACVLTLRRGVLDQSLWGLRQPLPERVDLKIGLYARREGGKESVVCHLIIISNRKQKMDVLLSSCHHIPKDTPILQLERVLEA